MEPYRRSARTLACIGVVAALVAGSLFSGCGGSINQVKAEDTVEHSFDLAAISASPRVTVTTINGNVTVRAGDPNGAEAHVTKRAQAEDEAAAKDLLDQVTVDFEQTGGNIVVRVTRATDPTGPRSNGADVEITVPSASSLVVRTSNGVVDVAGLESTVAVETSNARVSLAGGLYGADVMTSNGEVVVEGATGELHLATSNAAMRLAATDAIVDAETSNGAITFEGSLAGGSHRFETSNAKITFDGSLAAGSCRFETSNAAISLTLPADLAFAIDARTSTAKATTDFAIPDSAPDDDAVLSGTLPGGEAVQITAITSSAEIRIEKAR